MTAFRIGVWMLFMASGLNAAGCAARRPSPQLTAEMNAAQQEVNEGCFRCLERAIATFERLAMVPAVAADARRGAFEAAVLLVVRARELGMPDASFLVRAESLARGVHPHVASGLEASARLTPAAYLAALQIYGGDTSGLESEAREEQGRRRRTLFPGDERPAGRVALGPALASDALAQYLALAIDCEDPRARKQVSAAEVLARHPSTLMRFALALCGHESDRLGDLRAREPRWLDTLVFEGRRETTRYPRPDLLKGTELLQLAHDSFPESISATLLLGNARNSLSEHDAALALFDSVLATAPRHREALLGRVLALSYLSRHSEAIAAATQMVDLGTYLLGDAHYWRAWNRYQTYQLDPAWDDAERAIRLMVNTSSYSLAGYIAFARRDLDVAIARFEQAFRLDRSNCDAVWTEGLVHIDKSAWVNAAPRFGTAMECFRVDAENTTREVEELAATNPTHPHTLRQLALARKRVETSQHRQAQSAYNAAATYHRLGQRDEALKHLPPALDHPTMREKALTLKVQIDKLP